MKNSIRPFVHMAINAVDAVILDPDGHYDPELYDRYETFDKARDAALTSVEVLLDEGDYDGEDHREELQRMRLMLEEARTFSDLENLADYQWFLHRLIQEKPLAA